MKIGIYGGSFNPIHFGHIGLAKWVAENTDLDEVWLMVSPNNPLKDKSILADEQQRLANAQKAIRQEAKGDEAKGKIIVSDFEFHLPRPTYTANTLRALQQAYPEHEFTLIIGEDNLEIIDKWREYLYILKNYRVFVYPRHNIEHTTNHLRETILREATNLQLLADAPYFDISSTELRKNLHI
jgi:nicotinate-nucleotide adenylyltransferase